MAQEDAQPVTETWCDFGIEQANGVPKGSKFKEQLRMLKAKHHPIKQAPRFNRNVGRYNLLGNNVSACLTVTFDVGTGLKRVSATVDPDSHQDYDGVDPFEALACIERATRGYFVDTGRETREEAIMLFRQHEQQLKLAYLKETAVNAQAAAARATRAAINAYDEYLDALEEAGL